MSYLNEIRNKEGLPPMQTKRPNRGATIAHSYTPLFLKVIERTGVFIISEETLDEEKRECMKSGKSWQHFLGENNLYTDRLKSGGYKISKLKAFQPLSGYLQK